MRIYKPMPGTTINDAAEEMVKLANFSGEIVTATFNDIPLDTAPGGDAQTIISDFREASEQRRAAYIASPEYARRQKEEEERAAQKASALAAALAIAPATLTLRDEPAWRKSVEVNTDPYGSCVQRYADKWARVMEARIANGMTLEDCADEAASTADDEGITGFMYGCAVSILSQVWIHGEQLRSWHNIKTQIRDEGVKANESGGVLNPALLNIGGA